MTLLKSKEIRQLRGEEREQKLRKLQEELFHERGVSAMGGAPPNPGKIKNLRCEISRILTVEREEK